MIKLDEMTPDQNYGFYLAICYLKNEHREMLFKHNMRHDDAVDIKVIKGYEAALHDLQKALPVGFTPVGNDWEEKT